MNATAPQRLAATASGPVTPERAEAYWRDGYLSRVPVFRPEEAAELRARLEAIEAAERHRRGGAWPDRHYQPWDHPDGHPALAWVREVARDERLLDAVAAILGPDVLIRNADLFIKEPRSRQGIGWHLDTPMRDPTADGYLTVWLGLTDSTVENGGMWFGRGTHLRELPGQPKDRWSLTWPRGEAEKHMAADEIVANVMAAGECSMHHALTMHSSLPNRSDDRRVGFVIRFMAPRVTRAMAECGVATLVRGRDTHGHFRLLPDFPVTWTPQVP